MRKVGMYSGIVVAFLTVAVLWGQLDWPRPAGNWELKTFVDEMRDRDAELLDDVFLRTKQELYINRKTQDDYKSSGESTPRWLLDEQVDLEFKIDELEDEIDTLRELGK